MRAVSQAYDASMREMPTPELTRVLETAMQQHQPPLVRGRRIKLRYAHQGGRNPPIIVIHGNQVQHVPDAYRRYLAQRVPQDTSAWKARRCASSSAPTTIRSRASAIR